MTNRVEALKAWLKEEEIPEVLFEREYMILPPETLTACPWAAGGLLTLPDWRVSGIIRTLQHIRFM